MIMCLSDRQKQTMMEQVEDKIFQNDKIFRVKQWKSDSRWQHVCSKLDRHVQIKVAERGMKN